MCRSIRGERVEFARFCGVDAASRNPRAGLWHVPDCGWECARGLQPVGRRDARRTLPTHRRGRLCHGPRREQYRVARRHNRSRRRGRSAHSLPSRRARRIPFAAASERPLGSGTRDLAALDALRRPGRRARAIPSVAQASRLWGRHVFRLPSQQSSSRKPTLPTGWEACATGVEAFRCSSAHLSGDRSFAASRDVTANCR